MATAQENLIAARDQVAARIKEVTSAAKPSYSIDGKSISWTEYLDMLMRQYAKLQEKADGAWEIHVRGY